MKYLALLLLCFVSRASALECLPIEYGGDGRNLTVGTTTSGTWYTWNCVSPATETRIQLVVPTGFVIVAGHKPSATCIASGLNLFTNFNTMYANCAGRTEQEKTKFDRLLKSMATAQAKLPKEYP